MSQRRTRTLRADGMHQITVASLIGKRQGCFQTIPLQHFAEFSLSEHNEPWARYFYESNTDLDGLLDPNAHNAADKFEVIEVKAEIANDWRDNFADARKHCALGRILRH